MALNPAIVRRVRNQIPDADPVFGPNQDQYMFDAQSIEDFYTDASEMYPKSISVANILRAAAYANLALATSEGVIGKKIKTQDLQTDSSWVAELRQKAKELFAQADNLDSQAVLDFFEIIDYREGWTPEVPELTEWTWGYGR